MNDRLDTLDIEIYRLGRELKDHAVQIQSIREELSRTFMGLLDQTVLSMRGEIAIQVQNAKNEEFKIMKYHVSQMKAEMQSLRAEIKKTHASQEKPSLESMVPMREHMHAIAELKNGVETQIQDKLQPHVAEIHELKVSQHTCTAEIDILRKTVMDAHKKVQEHQRITQEIMDLRAHHVQQTEILLKEEIAKKDAQIQKLQEQLQKLRARVASYSPNASSRPSPHQNSWMQGTQ